MNFVINGIVDFKNVNNINIIKNIDKYNSVNVYENIYVNNINECFEIASIYLNVSNLNIKKISNNISYIYCVNFTYNISINLVVSTQLQQLKIVDICSKSFVYKNLDEKLIDVLPINIDVKKLDKQLGLCVNFIVVENLKTNTIEVSNIINNSKTPIDNSSTLISKKFAYIDVSEEFI